MTFSNIFSPIINIAKIFNCIIGEKVSFSTVL